MMSSVSIVFSPTKRPMNYCSKARIETFPDGVFAIIVTLVVLEIRVESIADLTFSVYKCRTA